MATIGLFEAFIALFSLLIFNTLLFKKPHDRFLRNWPVLGMGPGFLMNLYRISDFAVEVLENTDLTFPFKGPWFTGLDIVFTVDPANIHHITTTKFSNYIKGPKFQEIFDAYGDWIFNLDSEKWSKLKKCGQALLHGQKFQNIAVSATRYKLKCGLLPVFSHFAEKGTVVDLQDLFQRLMFDTSVITVTGSDPKSLSIEMPEDEFIKALKDVEVTILYRHVIPRFLWKLQNRMRLGQEKILIEAEATIDRLSDEYILAKRNEIRKGSTGEAKDVLTFFFKLDATKFELESIDDRFLRDVILTFIIAGRDAMASTLTWFFWLMSEHPKVMTKIYEEINTILPSFRTDMEKPSYDPAALDKLVYLRGALLETMRLYPPLPFERKSPVEADVLPSGHKVDADSIIMIYIYAMGRMKAIWGEDALEYKPERWVSETGRLRHEPSYKFFAFNAGPRTCLGKHIAMTQMKTVLVEILQNYDIEVVKGQNIKPLPGLILHMKDGLKVTLNKKC